MKAFYSIFVIILVTVLATGCGKSTSSGTDTVKTPMDSVAILKQSVQTFKTQEGHFPKTLDELTPKYIAKIPDAPGGYKYNYDPATGEVKLSR